MLKGKPATRTLLAGVALGVFTGLGAAFHLTRMNPEALGLFTFCGFLFGNGMRRG